MEPRCRAGDLAIVIVAHNRSNVGRIVKVLAQHDGKGDLFFHDHALVWVVEAPQPMTWSIGKRRIRRKRGPIPDSYLKPIRGNPIRRDVAAHQSLCRFCNFSEKLSALT
ncbi:hypothetical protein Q8A64_01095 [Oxalobacteraceae bacterium R-40]|uniref:Uncharacterized protein n=1 Tax=Keguizhuia sedimenti TaxID=3064264 RepID=A0ABU1BLR5_9BURK|nr:hypothetical protein [Oxalobacteraceae bacterium R-40]